MLFQSGGCCDGSSPLCLHAGELPPAPTTSCSASSAACPSTSTPSRTVAGTAPSSHSTSPPDRHPGSRSRASTESTSSPAREQNSRVGGHEAGGVGLAEEQSLGREELRSPAVRVGIDARLLRRSTSRLGGGSVVVLRLRASAGRTSGSNFWSVWRVDRTAVRVERKREGPAMEDAVIVSAVRTPVGSFGGDFKDVAGDRAGRARGPRGARAGRDRRRRGRRGHPRLRAAGRASARTRRARPRSAPGIPKEVPCDDDQHAVRLGPEVRRARRRR